MASCLSDQATPAGGATPPALMAGMLLMAGITPPAGMAGMVTKGGFTGCDGTGAPGIVVIECPGIMTGMVTTGGFTGCHGTGAPGIVVIECPGIMIGALGLARVGITFAPVCACVRVRGRARRERKEGFEGGGRRTDREK